MKLRINALAGAPVIEQQPYRERHARKWERHQRDNDKMSDGDEHVYAALPNGEQQVFAS